MNPEFNWHSRFLQQADWTQELRKYLLEKSNFPEAESILEVGCGTGAILSGIPDYPDLQLLGIDIDPNMIRQARQNTRIARFIIGDAHHLPYSGNWIDITFCHYLLLWVKSPLKVLLEMKRVTRAGGAIVVMAEPDYLGRIDEPESLGMLGKLQTEALKEQGADVGIGSKLVELFNKAEINLIETGKLEKMPSQTPDVMEENLEWTVMENDVKKYLTQVQLEELRSKDFEARRNGTRVIHIPTSFALGLV